MAQNNILLKWHAYFVDVSRKAKSLPQPSFRSVNMVNRMRVCVSSQIPTDSVLNPFPDCIKLIISYFCDNK